MWVVFPSFPEANTTDIFFAIAALICDCRLGVSPEHRVA